MLWMGQNKRRIGVNEGDVSRSAKVITAVDYLRSHVKFYLANLRVDDLFFFFSSRRRHTRFDCDWSSDVCSSDLLPRRLRGSPLPMRIDSAWGPDGRPAV